MPFYYDGYSPLEAAEGKYAEIRRLPDHLKVRSEPPRGVLEFHAGWHQFLRGELSPGGCLVVRYDLGRLESQQRHWWLNGLRAYVRFHPGGRLYEVTAFATSMLYRPPVYVWFELPVPLDAERAELWFHTEADEGERVYDSRYGQNYWFHVTGAAPPAEEYVRPGPGATVAPHDIRLNDASVFQFERFGKEGNEAVRVMQTFLTAEVVAPSGGSVWLDLHVFDGRYDLIHAEAVPLHWHADSVNMSIYKLAYQFDVRSSSLARIQPEPVVKQFRFRIYCRRGGKVYTDDILHERSL